MSEFTLTSTLQVKEPKSFNKLEALFPKQDTLDLLLSIPSENKEERLCICDKLEEEDEHLAEVMRWCITNNKVPFCNNFFLTKSTNNIIQWSEKGTPIIYYGWLCEEDLHIKGNLRTYPAFTSFKNLFVECKYDSLKEAYLGLANIVKLMKEQFKSSRYHIYDFLESLQNPSTA